MYAGVGTPPKDPTSTGGHDQTEQAQAQITAAVVASGKDHHYENMDNQNGRPGQGQSQAIIESNTNATAAVLSSGHDQTGQGQSQATCKALEAGNLSYGTGPTASKLNSLYKVVGQSQAIIEPNTNTTAAVVSSGQDHHYENMDIQNDRTGQGQTQTMHESNTNTTADVVSSGHDQTGQGQSQAIRKDPEAGNLSYGTGPTVSELNSLYKVVGQYQSIIKSNTNTTTAVITSGHDQTGHRQSQSIIESNTNTTAAVVTSGHDQTGHGQSQGITDSNTNTTAVVVTNGQDQTGHRQSQSITESNTNTTAAVVTSGQD
ncbi:Hypp7967 [Branchiostoma lanceolatum]|uniref:Hypp7967 protein n=1 Tax=Branchiostoma lanceolatum TaxID=7740 RepID=A0A8K0EE81_BRALA|nr:Hypp7967 [Branchiostoma lanceolatum]